MIRKKQRKSFPGTGSQINLGHAGLIPAMVLLGTVLVTGCTATPVKDNVSSGSQAAGKPLQISCTTNLTPEHRVELEAIDEMMASSKHYAALARLEALPFQTQQHWLRWAQLLAQVDQLDYSLDVYRQVAETCDSAKAWHGLGVVYVKSGQVKEGLEALSRAKSMNPASAAIRNDFGIVLMQAGFYGQAAFELRTAYELYGGKESAGRSMVAAYYLHGGRSLVDKVRRELNLDEDLVNAGIRYSRRFARNS